MAKNDKTINTQRHFHQPKQEFYRRELPKTCISFSSAEGKSLFQEALTSGHMECYFMLASQYRTQDEPAFCGLSTLVMILNALEIDPMKVWKGPWRWYHETMFDCCVPVKHIEQEGLTFGQFVCLAECNSLVVTSTYVDEKASLETFREAIMECTRRDDTIVALSYSRKTLSQTGDGHFSPVGGYHPEKDMVLILDTARFKYPPHWVSLPLLFEAMKSQDKTTGKPRGYVVLSRQPIFQPLLLFKISSSFLETFGNESFNKTFESWNEWLSTIDDQAADYNRVVAGASDFLLSEFSKWLTDQCIFTTQFDLQCCSNLSDSPMCTINVLLNELEKTDTFNAVSLYIDEKSQDFKIFGSTFVFPSENSQKVTCERELKPSHFLSMFLLAWPYTSFSDCSKGTNASKLKGKMCSTMRNSGYLANEIRQLRNQFTALMTT